MPDGPGFPEGPDYTVIVRARKARFAGLGCRVIGLVLCLCSSSCRSLNPAYREDRPPPGFEATTFEDSDSLTNDATRVDASSESSMPVTSASIHTKEDSLPGESTAQSKPSESTSGAQTQDPKYCVKGALACYQMQYLGEEVVDALGSEVDLRGASLRAQEDLALDGVLRHSVIFDSDKGMASTGAYTLSSEAGFGIDVWIKDAKCDGEKACVVAGMGSLGGLVFDPDEGFQCRSRRAIQGNYEGTAATEIDTSKPINIACTSNSNELYLRVNGEVVASASGPWATFASDQGGLAGSTTIEGEVVSFRGQVYGMRVWSGDGAYRAANTP